MLGFSKLFLGTLFVWFFCLRPQSNEAKSKLNLFGRLKASIEKAKGT